MAQHGPRDIQSVLDARYTLTDKGLEATGGPGLDEFRDATWIYAQRAEKAEATVAQVAAIHAEWGDTPTDEIDQLDLWERIDRALRGEVADRG